MKTFEEAKNSLKRATFNDEQRSRCSVVQREAEILLHVMWSNAQPSPELTMATRKLEEAVMWHSKAIANESK